MLSEKGHTEQHQIDYLALAWYFSHAMFMAETALKEMVKSALWVKLC